MANKQHPTSAVLVARPASASLIVAAQAHGAVERTGPDELTATCPDPAEGLDLALDLRRWSVHGRCGSPGIRIGVASGREGEERSGSIECAAALADSLPAGTVGVEPELAGSAGRRHHLAAPAEHPESLRLSWPPGTDHRTTIPAPASIALDRPWPMVGRRSQLVEIGEAWARTVAGAGGAVLLEGEPGVGKSRLLTEAVAEAHTAGGTTLLGAEGELTASPYGCFSEALSQLRAVRPELFEDTTLARVLELISPGTDGDPSARAGGLGDQRPALFDAIASVLERAAESAPILLALEDLHSGPESTLMLLSFLARRALPGLLIVASYRSTEIVPASEQEQILERIRSAAGTRHLQLSGLTRAELGQLTSSLTGPIAPALVDRVAAQLERDTAGNPLYASELLRSALEPDEVRFEERLGQASGSLRLLIEGRAASLGEPAYGHLRAAALAGRRFSRRVLERALAVDAAELDDSLLRAERSGLVQRLGDGEFAFSHALTAQCLADTLGGLEAGRLHRRLAESLDSEPATAALASGAARHWSLAEPAEPERAVGHVQRAGELALASLDHAAAREWFERGLELHALASDPDPTVRCDLLLGLGAALRFSGAEFREYLLEAGRIAAEIEDDDRLVAAAIANSRGFVSAAGELDRERVMLLELARKRTEGKQSAERALLLAQLALELVFTDEGDRRVRLAEEALRVARAEDDDRLLARVLLRRIIALWGPATLEQRIESASESVEISARLDEPLDLFHGLHWQGMALIEAGQLPDAERLLRESRAIAIRLEDQTALWLAEFGRTCLLMVHGKLDAAEAAADAALKLGQDGQQPDALPFYASQLAAIRWHQGRLGELAQPLAEVLEENPGIQGLRSLVVLALTIAGEPERALGELRVDAAGSFSGIPRDPIWLPVMATYGHAVAELAAAGVEELTPVAIDLRRLIGPFEDQLASTTVSVWGVGSHCLGRLAAVAGERSTAIEQLERSVEYYERLGAPVWRGLACRHLAEAIDAGGRDGRRQAERLRAEAVRIGFEREAPELLRMSGQPVGAVVEEQDQTRLTASRLGLTARQLEVARMAAVGLSNGAIGTQLNISPSTVKRHLEDTYRELGISGRRELAHRGLADGSGSPER